MKTNNDPVRSQKIVTVCASCLTETCLQTSLKCADAAITGTITDTEENIAALQSGEAETNSNAPKGLEIIGPFNDYRVTIDGYEVPKLRAVRVNGLISMTLDHRFGCDIPDDKLAYPIIHFIATAMAIGAGYSCFGENAKPANPFKCRLIGLNLTQVEDGPVVHAEAEQ
jgi:hypothetical protein